MTVCYSTTQPANEDDPASYANVFTRGQGTFGPDVEIVWNGDQATTKGGRVWWLVKTVNAAGVETKTGSTELPADAPEPTVWSGKTINLEPEPVMAYRAVMTSTNTHGYHYRMTAYDQWLGSQPVKVGFDDNGCRTGRVAEWFKHKAKRSAADSNRDEWGRYYDVGTPSRVNRGIADDWFALMRPEDGDREGRPLVVILHGRDSGCGGFFAASSLMCDEGCCRVPDDAYGIALDCRENSLNDYWWGGMPPATPTAGLLTGESDARESYYGFLFGGRTMGLLYQGPTFDPFKKNDSDVIHDWNDLAWCHQVGYPNNPMGLPTTWNYDPPGDTPTMKRVLDTIEWAVRKYKIDRNRIYLAGNSMGGQGALAIGLKHGEVFAAINGNVPATVVYPASQMGFIDLEGKDVSYEQFQRPAYDPPVCVDISGSNDAWSRDHDIMYRNMNRFRYSYTGYWQPLGHNAGYAETRAVNPHAMRFDYFSVVKNRAYPVFSNADGNSRLPWPQQSWVSADAAGGTVGPDGVESAAGELEAAQNADLIGQWNSYFRWETVTDTDDTLQFRLWIANEKEIPDGGPYVRPQSLAVDVSPRRLQHFPKELSGQGWWEMGGQSGNIEWDDITGCYTAERVTVTRTPTILTFHASGRAVAPTVTAALAGDPTGSSASYKVNVSAVGTGASSVKLTAKYGTDPQNLDKSTTLATSVTAGEATYTISGLNGMRTKYYVRIFAENNKGVSTTVDCGSFETFCAHANRGIIATAKAATCTEEGVSAGEQCLDCGFVFTRSKTTAALGHDFKFDHWVHKVTATEDGLLIRKCTRCPETEEKTVKAGTVVDGEVPYLDYDADIGMHTNAVRECAFVTDETRTLTNGWYAVTKEVAFAAGANLTVDGDAHLILCDGASLTIVDPGDHAAGISVVGANGLTIYGQSAGSGTLTAQGGEYSAGIGGFADGSGRDEPDCGTVTIIGGTVVATGGLGAAGIGCSPMGRGGHVAIHGGTVTATSGLGGTGIGCCEDPLVPPKDGSEVVITGGKVSASGLRYDIHQKDIHFASASISGGVFAREPKVEWCAAGYAVFANPDADTRGDYPYAVLHSCTVTIGVCPEHVSAAWTSGEGTATNAIVGMSFAVPQGADAVRVIFAAETDWELVGEAEVRLDTVTDDITFGEGNGYRVPQARYLLGDIPYLDWDGTQMTNAALPKYVFTFVTQRTRELTDGWYAVTNSVVFPVDANLEVHGTAHLVLCDGALLTITNSGMNSAAVAVPTGASLTIYGQEAGTGELVAMGGCDSAGIGGFADWDDPSHGNCGAVTINGGTVTAQGGENAAGIGGGYATSEPSYSTGDVITYADGGVVTINGGMVTATGGGGIRGGGAGIGGGYFGAGGVATIAGGAVKVVGDVGAEDIGHGYGSHDSGAVSVSGGIFARPVQDAWLASDHAVITNQDAATVAAYPWAVVPYPAAWPAADDAVKAKFEAWRNGDGAEADLAAGAAQKAFLLNVPVTGLRDLVIEGITVDAEGYATIVVRAPGMFGFNINIGNINGVLYVHAGDTLETMTPKAVAYWTTTGGKAMIKVKANFIRAAIGFKEP